LDDAQARPRAGGELDDARAERVDLPAGHVAKQPGAAEGHSIAMSRGLARAEARRHLRERELRALGGEEPQERRGSVDGLIERGARRPQARSGFERRGQSASTSARSASTIRFAWSRSITSGGDITIFWPVARTITPRARQPPATGAASYPSRSSTPSISPTPRTANT